MLSVRFLTPKHERYYGYYAMTMPGIRRVPERSFVLNPVPVPVPPGTTVMDIRQILTDNAIRDMHAEMDGG